jgi:hypothetical protein
MTPDKLIRSIYFGDRSIKSILLDGPGSKVSIQIDCISRIRDPSGNWNFYTAEDIPNGLLVFTGVDSIKFSPPGPIPNDAVYSLSADTVPSGYLGAAVFRFELLAGAVDRAAHSQEILIEILAQALHLEDPEHPGQVISS